MVAGGDKLSGGLYGIKFFCPIFVKSEGRQYKPREYESPGVSYLEMIELFSDIVDPSGPIPVPPLLLQLPDKQHIIIILIQRCGQFFEFLSVLAGAFAGGEMFFYLFGQLSRFHIPDKISLVEIVA